MRRLTTAEWRRAVDDLDSIALEIGYLEINAELAASAGDLAQTHGLRGDDAVPRVRGARQRWELVLVTGDRDARLGYGAPTSDGSVLWIGRQSFGVVSVTNVLSAAVKAAGCSMNG